MGDRGPMPTPNRQRSGRNQQRANTELEAAGEVVMPPPDDGWCAEATEWYESLAESAQAIYYEPSDWQFARLLASELSAYLGLPAELRGAAKFDKLLKGWTNCWSIIPRG